MVKGLALENELMPTTDIMAEAVASKVSDMVSDFESINNRLTRAKSKCYLCSVLVGTGIGICAFEVVRLVVSFM